MAKTNIGLIRSAVWAGLLWNYSILSQKSDIRNLKKQIFKQIHFFKWIWAIQSMVKMVWKTNCIHLQRQFRATNAGNEMQKVVSLQLPKLLNYLIWWISSKLRRTSFEWFAITILSIMRSDRGWLAKINKCISVRLSLYCLIHISNKIETHTQNIFQFVKNYYHRISR